ncbi:hypothetical protein [Streptomyces agglomeratus]|uniref:hypothetical protein n=1 Tax=Streptomyces agglomeratus TaxID=285458 RepID=UPI0008547ECC|nr:hypothetical protein [Streptomyces agglomeratus]OEJ36271.1 hypothetical protein BGK72_38565 [Streptomyces agglomeratus]
MRRTDRVGERFSIGKVLLGCNRKAPFLMQFKLQRFRSALVDVMMSLASTVVRTATPLRQAI